MMSVLADSTPLQLNYLPRQIVNRDDKREAINAVFNTPDDTGLGNIFIHGSRGTGKTHLTRLVLTDLPDDVDVCYVPCTQCDTQYKVLQRLCQQVTDDSISTGIHTSELQRRFEQYSSQQRRVVVLDEIDFLLMNDGDSLLYSLCRIEHSENIGIVAISANHSDLASQLEERTYSSLYPQRIEFTPYTGENIYQILLERARNALKEQSLHQEALTYIASATTNAALGLTWLKTAAQNTDQAITEQTVQETRKQAYKNYTDYLLQPFTQHYRLLYQAITELTEEKEEDPVIQSGSIYSRYKDLCQTYSEEPLSNRRISDYLKQLELLNLIQAEYHYGGNKGKTREISLTLLQE